MRQEMSLSIRCVAAKTVVYLRSPSCDSRPMSQAVTLPLWLFVLILLFAVVTALSHFLLPSVRWFLRKRMERAVERLNKRLDRPIQPFKLLTRPDTINRVVYSPEVMAAVQLHAEETGVPEQVAFEKARGYAREIVPGFSTAAYFGFATRAAMLISRALYRVRLGAYDEEAIRKIDPDATVIFVMNHRSNMDYVLVTYLVAGRSALAYAVGEWARVWPLRTLVKALGGYFIRRRSRNALYRRVLARYVQMSTAGGVTQAIFPEGGLSLDGRVGPAKLGLLSYVVNTFDPDGPRDVYFVPVGINYDRVIEDRFLTRALQTGERRFRVSVRKALWAVIRQLGRHLTGKFYRFGYAAVSFGAPVSLKEQLARNKGEDPVSDLGDVLTERVREIVPVLPAPLVAAVLVRSEDFPLQREEIVTRVSTLRAELARNGAHLHLPRDDPDYEVTFGLRQLKRQRLIKEDKSGYAPLVSERAVLEYYANSVLQLMPEPSAPPHNLVSEATDRKAAEVAAT